MEEEFEELELEGKIRVEYLKGKIRGNLKRKEIC